MEYFVSYSHTTGDNKFGFGNINILLDKPIGHMETIKDIQDYIMKQNPEFESVVIINYIMLN